METVPVKRSRLTSPAFQTNQFRQPSTSAIPPTDDCGSHWLTEFDVAIQSFVNPKIPGFNCTLKNRWEDFMVQEISHGACAQLTSTDPVGYTTDHFECEGSSVERILEPYLAKLTDLFNHQCNEIKLEAPDSKELRTRIHKAIRAMYPKFDSRTVKENDHQLIIVNRKSGVSRSRVPKAQAYCRFVLYKEGKDTISAIQLLGRCLHIPAGCFAYAGTKDRRAITTQFVTLKGVDSHRLSALNQKLRGIRLGNFSYVPKPLFLGDLDGNRFTIVLRSVVAEASVIHEAVEVWKRDGFINYYGLQRFGHSAKTKSFDTGRYIIRNEWNNAIKMILLPTEADLPSVRHLKEEYKRTNDAKQCADNGPPCIERELLWAIDKYGATKEALQSLPRNLRQLYVHSYQSLIWNLVATRRVRDLPLDTNNRLQTVAGDLYLPGASTLTCDPLVEFPTNLEDMTINDASEVMGPTLDKGTFPCPKVATEADCALIPITDVVLPLPGFAVRYPENQSGQWYHDLLRQDELTMEDFRHQVKDFSLPGSYRTLIVKPQDVSYTIREYTDPDVPLIESDLQKLENSLSTTNSDSNHDSHKPMEGTKADQTERAVILQFTLPKSSYATVAIRELTKSFVEKR